MIVTLVLCITNNSDCVTGTILFQSNSKIPMTVMKDFI